MYLFDEVTCSRHLSSSDEVTPTDFKSLNLLADLVQRQQAEQEGMIKLHRSLAQDTTSEQAKLLPIVLVKVEKSLAKKEDWFDLGALSVGLFERINEALNIRYTLCSQTM